MTDEQKRGLLQEIEQCWIVPMAINMSDEEKAEARNSFKAKQALRRLVEAVGGWQKETRHILESYADFIEQYDFPGRKLISDINDFDPFKEAK